MSKSQHRITDVTKRALAKVEKFEARRAELADAALETLAELGYANTSLRLIADNSEFSHGVFHHYFSDKLDLIIQSVRQYKAVCVQRYDVATSQADSCESLLEGFLEKLSETLRDEAHLHRLWYDLRSQALFENALRDDVREIDRSLENMVYAIVSRYAELAGSKLSLSSKSLYALFDGLFQNALAKVIAGDEDAISDLCDEFRYLLPAITK